MKKLFVLAFAALACISLNAKSPYTVISGSTACFKEDAQAVFVIDYSKATFQHEMTLEEENPAAWEERLALMYEGFTTGFNQNPKKKRLNVATAAEAAKYTMTLHISNIDRKACPTMTWADKTLSIEGTLDVVDNASGEKVCEINIDKYMLGLGSLKVSTRIRDSFNGLGSTVAKVK